MTLTASANYMGVLTGQQKISIEQDPGTHIYILAQFYSQTRSLYIFVKH